MPDFGNRYRVTLKYGKSPRNTVKIEVYADSIEDAKEKVCAELKLSRSTVISWYFEIR